MQQRFALCSLVVASLTLLAGCGQKEVAKEDVEKQARTLLTEKVGKESPPITCPGALKAEVGTTMVCSIPLDDKTYDVTIKVTAVDGSKVSFETAVSDKPRE